MSMTTPHRSAAANSPFFHRSRNGTQMPTFATTASTVRQTRSATRPGLLVGGGVAGADMISWSLGKRCDAYRSRERREEKRNEVVTGGCILLPKHCQGRGPGLARERKWQLRVGERLRPLSLVRACLLLKYRPGTGRNQHLPFLAQGAAAVVTMSGSE